MQQIIIFEGADDTGKSNIAKELARQLNIPYWKDETEHFYFLNKGFFNKIRFALPVLFDFILKTKTSAILDRSFISEEVYGEVFNRLIPLNEIEVVKSLLYKSDAEVFIVYCNKTQTKETFQDEIISFEQNEKIKLEYEKYFKTKNCFSMIRIDTTDQNLQKQVSRILGHLVAFNKATFKEKFIGEWPNVEV